MIVPISNENRTQVNESIKKEWAGPLIISNGVSHDSSKQDGFASITNGNLTGYILYKISDSKCEITVLQSLLENHGIGSELINAVKNAAIQKGCKNLWLITTNDNLHAIRFYQKFGFDLVAVHFNAVDSARKLKPSIPLFGDNGIPVKHEFEFSLRLI